MTRSILLVDDDPAVIRLLEKYFQRSDWTVSSAATGEEGLRRYQADRPDVVVLDVNLPGASGLDILDVLVARDATVILLTGQGDIETAVEAMKLGAENFLSKPIELAHLGAVAERALEKGKLRAANQNLAERLAAGRTIESLGRSGRMEDLARQIELVAASDQTTVLLFGESGTGKGWVAEMIHAHSPRKRGPMVEINCAGLTATFLDSELFGHEKGAFTDAKTTKRGLFEEADGGTLFLDEIGDLAPELQPKLLKVLERKAFRRLGGTKEIEVDVRLVAATNLDLEERVRTGAFREDLYYRLRVMPITLPPLRERSRDDILELAYRLLAGLHERHPDGPERISEDALELLVRYPWPGNVRELRNVLERALVLAGDAERIRASHLPDDLRRAAKGGRGVEGRDLLSLEEMERRHIEHSLRTLEGNRSRTAEVLGVSRATLHNKIKKYGMEAVGREGA